MNQRTKELISRMESYFLPAELERRAAAARTTQGQGLDDKDVFSNDGISMQDVLELKRIFNRTGEPVRREHFDTVYEAYRIYPYRDLPWESADYDKRWSRLISEEDREYLEAELKKDRLLPPPVLPDRALTIDEKNRVIKQIRGFTRMSGGGTTIYVEVPKGNGMRTDDIRTLDTAVHRRLEEIRLELMAIEDSLMPPEAKDQTPHDGKSYWTKGDEWRSKHIKTCHYCGVVDEVRLPKC